MEMVVRVVKKTLKVKHGGAEYFSFFPLDFSALSSYLQREKMCLRSRGARGHIQRFLLFQISRSTGVVHVHSMPVRLNISLA